MKQSRRDFIITTSAATAGVAFGPEIFAQKSASNTIGYPIAVFTKCLQFLDYAKLGETLSSIGFKNAELSVREGGVSWPLGMKLLSPWIKTNAIKDFIWKKEADKWKITNVQLGEGMVDYLSGLNSYWIPFAGNSTKIITIQS